MIIKKLEVSGLRAFKQASFEFKPGMNLLVGVNGVGKTSVLDALRICLSKILKETSSTKSPAQGFEIDDIKYNYELMHIGCNFEIEDKPFKLLINKQRKPVVSKELGTQRELKKKRRSREMREVIYEQIIEEAERESIETPNYENIVPDIDIHFPKIKTSKNQTLAIFFSTRRSLYINKKPSRTSKEGGISAAFAESLLINRELNLKEITDWYRTREVLGAEDSRKLKYLHILKEALSSFLPGFKNLQLTKSDDENVFNIEKNGENLLIKQLSDGERGLFCLVMELSKRLSQANPLLDNPNKEGKAIVLIDELDLHLHPQWQRTIVENLTKTFPKCQFIATTHSPQIIPSVEPENILLIKENVIIRPDRSLGMDTNWILRILMETADRPEFSAKAIESVEKLIEKGKLDEANEKIEKFIFEGLDIPEWSILRTRIAKFKSF